MFVERKRSSRGETGYAHARTRAAADGERRRVGRAGAAVTGSGRSVRVDGPRRAGRAGDGPVDEGETGAAPPVLARGATRRSDAPVVHLRPDAPGSYALTLDAPDGTHRQRVRVFPDERREAELRVPAADLPLPDADVDRVSLMWAHNERRLARDRPERDG